MSYQSFAFFAFTAAVLIVYYLVGAVTKRGQIFVLAAANLAFYAIAGVKYLPYILVTMVATYLAGLIIGRIYKKNEERIAAAETPAEKKALRAKAKSRAKLVLLGGLLVTIALLAVCKYTTFVMTNVNSILVSMGKHEITIFKMVLPLGISYYSFMAISYVLDIYWKRYKYESNFIYYAVYLSYFPHVVQGPIDRFNEFKDQIKDGVKLSYKNLTHGAQLAIWGLFKKLVIADRIGIFVDKILGDIANYDGAFIMLAVAVFSIQIYADFSGCIDIVRGVSEMLGIQLRRNFNNPYFSKTMPEFWRRWHISLQEWFKDYIYYPVSASGLTKKVKKFFKGHGLKRLEVLFASCFPIAVVWMITGIWHGAAWKFVAWGIFHAIVLIGSTVLEPVFRKINKLLRIDTENFGWQLWQMARTFFICCVGRIFFRASGMTQALAMIKKMITDTHLHSLLICEWNTFGLDFPNLNIALLAMLVLLIGDILHEKFPVRETLAKQNLIFRWIIILLGLFAVIIYGMYGPGFDAASFIYEQF